MPRTPASRCRSKRGTFRISSKRAGSRRKSSSPKGATARPTSGASSSGRPPSTPSKKYPVIENIYAGPQGSFVPKSFAAFNQMQAQAEIGFIVVQIDGMGTSNRVEGLPRRRVAEHQGRRLPGSDPVAQGGRRRSTRTTTSPASACTARRPAVRTRSAACSSSRTSTRPPCPRRGCHDNRMDKIWWNEQWMGWPIGPQYAESSNVDNAHRLQGKVLLVVGEMDSNVDPSSTMQVVNAADQARQGFRSARRARHGARLGRRVRRPQTLRLLLASSARRQAARMEGARGRDEESDANTDEQRGAVKVKRKNLRRRPHERTHSRGSRRGGARRRLDA